MIFFSKLSLKSYFDEITLKKIRETLSKLRKDLLFLFYKNICNR